MKRRLNRISSSSNRDTLMPLVEQMHSLSIEHKMHTLMQQCDINQSSKPTAAKLKLSDSSSTSSSFFFFFFSDLRKSKRTNKHVHQLWPSKPVFEPTVKVCLPACLPACGQWSNRTNNQRLMVQINHPTTSKKKKKPRAKANKFSQAAAAVFTSVVEFCNRFKKGQSYQCFFAFAFIFIWNYWAVAIAVDTAHPHPHIALSKHLICWHWWSFAVVVQAHTH